MKKTLLCISLLTSLVCYSSDRPKIFASDDISVDLSGHIAQGQLAQSKREERRKRLQACCCMSAGVTIGYFSELIYPAAPVVPYIAAGSFYMIGSYFFYQAVDLDIQRKTQKYKQD